MSEFTYKADVLSTNSPHLFKELSNYQYKNFVKVIVNEDKEIFDKFSSELLQELCADTSVNIKKLTALDKLYLLLIIRAYNISPSITFVCETNEQDKEGKPIKANINIDIVELLQRLETINISPKFEITNNDVKVYGSLPKQFYYSTDIEAVSDCVDTVVINDNHIDLTNFTVQQKVETVNKLPSYVLPDIYRFLTTQEELIRQDPFIVINTEREITTPKETFISFLNGSMPETVKLFYRVDLRDFYTNEYTLIKKFKFTYDHIAKITPAELSLYVDVIREDQAKEKEEMDKREKESNQDYLPRV
jgi:hypothetical protein